MRAVVPEVTVPFFHDISPANCKAVRNTHVTLSLSSFSLLVVVSIQFLVSTVAIGRCAPMGRER